MDPFEAWLVMKLSQVSFLDASSSDSNAAHTILRHETVSGKSIILDFYFSHSNACITTDYILAPLFGEAHTL